MIIYFLVLIILLLLKLNSKETFIDLDSDYFKQFRMYNYSELDNLKNVDKNYYKYRGYNDNYNNNFIYNYKYKKKIYPSNHKYTPPQILVSNKKSNIRPWFNRMDITRPWFINNQKPVYKKAKINLIF